MPSTNLKGFLRGGAGGLPFGAQQVGGIIADVSPKLRAIKTLQRYSLYNWSLLYMATQVPEGTVMDATVVDHRELVDGYTGKPAGWVPQLVFHETGFRWCGVMDHTAVVPHSSARSASELPPRGAVIPVTIRNVDVQGSALWFERDLVAEMMRA